MKRTRLITIIFSLILVGCGHYGPYSYWGGNDSGYVDTQFAENKWDVRYLGNTMTDPQKAQDYVMLRAAELTLDAGYRYFIVDSSVDQSRIHTGTTQGTMTEGSSASAQCVAGYYSAACSGDSTTTTTYRPPSTYEIQKLGVGLYITAFKEKPEQWSFDAQLIKNNIRKKYSLD